MSIFHEHCTPRNFRDNTPVWLPERAASIPANLKHWLTDKGSMTVKLSRAFSAKVEVKILQQSWTAPDWTELKFLKTPEQRYMVRRVQLILNGVPRIYARSVFPESYLRTPLCNNIYRLGQRPLGEMLFGEDAVFIRSEFEIARVYGYQIELDSGLTEDKPYWGRRSLFLSTKQYPPILVTEYFLTDMPDKSD